MDLAADESTLRIVIYLAVLPSLLALAGCSHCGSAPPQPSDAGIDSAADAGMDTSETTDTVPPEARCLQQDFQAVPDRRCDTSDTSERCTRSPDALDYPIESAVAYDLEFEKADGDFQIDRDSEPDYAYSEFLSLIFGALERNFVEQRVENGALVLSARAEEPYESGDAMALDRLVPASDSDRDFSERKDGSLTGNPGREFRFATGNFEAGTVSNGWLQFSEVSEDTIRADRGRVELGAFPPSLFMIPRTIRVYRFRGDRPPVTSSDDPLFEEGRLGGYVELRPLLERLNRAMSRCDCLGMPDDPIPFETEGPNDPDIAGRFAALSCRSEVDEATDNCDDNEAELACRYPGIICGFVGDLSAYADIDSDCDGSVDSSSIELEMKMTSGSVTAPSDGS